MARFAEHHQIAVNALRICEAVREEAPLELYSQLAAQCASDPERMAQLLMCLAAWVDWEGSTAALEQRVQQIVEGRVSAAGARRLA